MDWYAGPAHPRTAVAAFRAVQFKIFDGEGVAEARRSLEAGSNPWSAEPRVIASVDFIKRREGAFRELPASRWDVIIIDEAHHPASGGNDDELTDRFRLARWLAAENTGALLLLTASSFSVAPCRTCTVPWPKRKRRSIAN